ncbi:LolA family protein [Vibrio gallicus]|uniref:LolA family protein n=1 Tax=Vibrio gallicus TaxID=190897 RepID=UPI0021C4C6B9|nr:outer membrane lipoprotein carrier protein LolA [Vibrio gallicus]
MIRRILLCLVLFSGFAQAQVTDLDSLQTQLAKHPTVRGDFVQSRHLEMFSAPLTSSGTFTLNKQQGLLWQQGQPFAVDLVLTEDKLRQSIANQAPQIITAKQNPMAFYFSRIFLAVFQGDTSALQAQFDLELTTNKSDWTLLLTPTQAPLNAVFKQITLSGDTEINSLKLTELRGDITEITFSNQSHQPAQLSDKEVAQFRF